MMCDDEDVEVAASQHEDVGEVSARWEEGSRRT